MAQMKVFVLHPSFERCQKIIEAFGQWEDLQFVPFAELRRAPERIQEEQPDLVIVAVDSATDPSLKVIGAIPKKGEKPAIMVVSKEPSQEVLLTSMRAGSDEFLQFPFDKEELSQALVRLKKKVGIITEEEGKIVAVYSAAGGCGTTSLACNLAAIAARELARENSSCILDLNLQYGTVALCMDIRQFTHSLVDAARDIERLDVALLESYVSPHDSGAAVLPAPVNLEDAQDMDPESIGPLLDLCRKTYKLSLLDLPHNIDDSTIVSLDAADEIFLLCDMMLPTIRNTIHAREVLEGLGYKKEKIKLIINRYYDSGYISLAEMSEHIKLPVYWLVPYDSATVMKALNSGRTFTEVAPGSDITSSVTALARVTAGLSLEQKQRKKRSLLPWRRQ